MAEDDELIERLARVMYAYDSGLSLQTCIDLAVAVVPEVRAYDREQRAKIDQSLAPKPEALARHNANRHGGMSLYVETRRDPDDYRDPFAIRQK